MQRARAKRWRPISSSSLGSSLVVYPAAGFPQLAKRNGAALVIVNREPTGLDRIADLVLHTPIGDTMGEAVGVAGRPGSRSNRLVARPGFPLSRE